MMISEFLPFARPRPGTTPPYFYPDYQSTQKRAPKRAPIRFEHTLSEVTGPDFADRWAGLDAIDELVGEHRLDLALELVRGREAPVRRPGARGGPALGAGGTHCRPKRAAAKLSPQLAGSVARRACTGRPVCSRTWPRNSSVTLGPHNAE